MTTKEKARSLAKVRTKEKHKAERKLKEQIELDEENKKLAEIVAEKGIKNFALIAFDHVLAPEEHPLAQAGALGIHREHLKETTSKTRLTLQGLEGKPLLLFGVVNNVKFDSKNNMIAFMLANPFVKINNQSVKVDSHIWVFFDKMSTHPDINEHFIIGLGCVVALEVAISSYRSHGKLKYGIEEWIVSHSGISYFLPISNEDVEEISLSPEDSNIVFPFVEFTYTPNKCTYTCVSKDDYVEGERQLLEFYNQMHSNINVGSKKYLHKIREDFERNSNGY